MEAFTLVSKKNPNICLYGAFTKRKGPIMYSVEGVKKPTRKHYNNTLITSITREDDKWRRYLQFIGAGRWAANVAPDLGSKARGTTG